MKHMLVSADEIKPGDNWTDSDNITYIVYANIPHPQDESARTISVVSVGSDQLRIARHLDRPNNYTFLLQRPLI